MPQALSESHFDVDDREVNLKEEIKQKTEKKLIQDDLEMLRSNPTKISNSINNSLLEKEIREKKEVSDLYYETDENKWHVQIENKTFV